MNTEKKKVCLIFGGKSTEYKVSLRSVCSVLSNIDRERFDVSTVGITEAGAWYLYRGAPDMIADDTWKNGDVCPIIIDMSKGSRGICYADGAGDVKTLDIDVIFPVVHGKYCEDGTLQGLLSMCGIPYVGSNNAASAVCMDKTLTKLILSNYEVPQANALVVDARELSSDEDDVVYRIENMFQYPVFVKPSSSGSSVGASKAADRTNLLSAMKEAALYDRKVLIEEYIVGREVEIAALEEEDGTVKLSCCGEIDPGDGFYDYETKYENDTAKYYIPAHILPETELRIKETASLIFSVLGCRGLSRIDFFVRDFKGTEQIIFNEINSLPGFTSISMYPQLMEHVGVPYGELITRLINTAGV